MRAPFVIAAVFLLALVATGGLIGGLAVPGDTVTETKVVTTTVIKRKVVRRTVTETVPFAVTEIQQFTETRVVTQPVTVTVTVTESDRGQGENKKRKKRGRDKP